jgi:hypothetical protein
MISVSSFFTAFLAKSRNVRADATGAAPFRSTETPLSVRVTWSLKCRPGDAGGESALAGADARLPIPNPESSEPRTEPSHESRAIIVPSWFSSTSATSARCTNRRFGLRWGLDVARRDKVCE